MAFLTQRRLLALAVLLLSVTELHAQATYCYTGNNFTVAESPYTTSDSISGCVTLSSALPPDTQGDLINVNAEVISFEFTDGLYIITQNDPMVYRYDFEFATTESVITQWRALIYEPPQEGGFMSTQGLYSEDYSNDNTSWAPPYTELVYVYQDPGAWSNNGYGACGDNRDNIISEYIEYGVQLFPKCSWFTQTAHSQYFTFSQINTPCPSQGTPEYSWALVRQPLVISAGRRYGLDDWQNWYTRLTGDENLRTINSGYRDPYQNQLCGGAPQSRHQYGDAVDFRNVTRTLSEWHTMWSAAGPRKANADFREPLNGPCGIGCVHADWRYHSGGYQSSGSMKSQRGYAVSDVSIEAVLHAFGSKSWRVRSEAFYRLLRLILGKPNGSNNVPEELSSLLHASRNPDQIRRALNNLLLEENSYVAAQEQVPEDYLNYYGDLVLAVSSLRDPESLDALLGAIKTGDMATSAIAAFGSKAVAPLIELLRSSDPFLRESATDVLSEMLEPSYIRAVSATPIREQVKQALLKSAADPSHYVRLAAIPGLLKLGDADCVSTVENLSENDPTDASMYGGKSGYYPVREAAKAALLELKH